MMLLNALKSNRTLNTLQRASHPRVYTRCARFSPSLVGRLPRCTVTTSVIQPQIHHRRRFSIEASRMVDSNDEDEEEDDDILSEVQEANMRCQGKLEIRKTNNQWGVHTLHPITQGSIILSSQPKEISTQPTTISCAHSIQIGWKSHLLMNLPARFMNHSCEPNVGVVGLNESGSYDFVALVDIGMDEELTFDYETTEYEIGAFSKCLCGSPNCRGKVYGYKYSGEVIRKKYCEENISSYLLQDVSLRK